MTDHDSAPTRVAKWVAPDLKTASVADPFTLYGHILDELEDREVVRTRNQPLGDYAEWLTWQALGCKQSTNKAEKAYDVTADLGADLLSGTGPEPAATTAPGSR